MDVQRKQQIRFILPSFQTVQWNSKRNQSFYIAPCKTHQIKTNLRNSLWQEWGGHIHRSQPCGDGPVLLNTSVFTSGQ